MGGGPGPNGPPSSKREKFAPVEPCVDPIEHAGRKNGTLDENGRSYYEPAKLEFDLDGDGVPDPVLAADRDANTTQYEIYLRRKGCSRYTGGARLAGTIVGVRGMSNGLRVLDVVGPCDDACTEVPHQELKFDGQAWVLGAKWTVPKR
jgi:hypothetical protein